MRAGLITASSTIGALCVLAGCAESHDPPRPLRSCDPDAPESTCEADEACRATLDGEHLCMRTCERSVTSLCDTGEACVNRVPGPPHVCWIGGPMGRGDPCEHDVECARGLRCNRQRVCEEACDSPELVCTTPGLRCDGSVCQIPIPAGTPCADTRDCDPDFTCGPETLFTCQPRCPSEGLCADGSSCEWDAYCAEEGGPARIEGCERTADGSIGCDEGEVCVLTEVGVRRCVRAGCRPDNSGGVSCAALPCLPDPEQPTTAVCWPGGRVELGEPCSDSHACAPGAACNGVGVCAWACRTEGAECSGEPRHVCRDFVCTPEA